jgi:hypothetical protein
MNKDVADLTAFVFGCAAVVRGVSKVHGREQHKVRLP